MTVEPCDPVVAGFSLKMRDHCQIIERIGFTTDSGIADDLGRLRMVSFRSESTTDEGDRETRVVEIPLLSLVPIPSIEITEADFEFLVKITDIQIGQARTSVSEAGPPNSEWLSPRRVEFRAALGSMDRVGPFS